MTEQEQQLIAGLAERLRNTPPHPRDRDADDLIQQTIGARPDALYVLTQTVLLQDMALERARAQLQELEQKLAGQQPPQPAAAGSFLHPASQPADWGREGRVQQAPSPAYPPQPGYQQPVYAQPESGIGGIGSFLRTAATTAAGVMAGEIAFDSLTSLFSHRSGGGFFGGGGGGAFFGGDEGRFGGNDISAGDSQFAEAARDSDQGISSDIEDERDASGSGFFDDGGDSGSDDGN